MNHSHTHTQAHHLLSPAITDIKGIKDTKTRFTILDLLACLYVIFLPMQFSTPIGLRLAPSDLLLMCYLIVAILRLPIRKSSWSIWHLLLLLVFAYGNFVTLFENGSVSRYVFLEKDIGLVMLYLGYLMIVSYVSDWNRCRRLVRTFIWSTVVQNLVAIAAFFLGQITGIQITWLNYESARLAGMLVDPNAYGGLLTLVFALHIMTAGKKNPLITGWRSPFCTITLGIGIVLTFSRSAWIGLALILLIVALFRPLAMLKLYAAFAVTLSVILLVLGNSYLSVITQMSTRQSQITARLDYIQISMQRFIDRPILGVGLGTFEAQYGWMVHNSTIWLLAEFGLVGLVVFLGFILWFFQKGWAAYRMADAEHKPLLFGFWIGHLSMYGLSMGIEALYQRHWWLVMGLIASGHALVRQERAERALNQRSGPQALPGMEVHKEVYGNG